MVRYGRPVRQLPGHQIKLPSLFYAFSELIGPVLNEFGDLEIFYKTYPPLSAGGEPSTRLPPGRLEEPLKNSSDSMLVRYPVPNAKVSTE